MPATKKVVNPEKELRGKKPYNRAAPGVFQKKSYQAKPKQLSADEVPEGAAALKKKLRDTLRLLSKNPKMPADIRQEHERRIEALKLQVAEKQVDQTEQKMATKYRMVKFFESKKADRRIKVFIRQHPNWESNESERKELESLKLDLAYIQHYPKTQKYISLYPNENVDDPVVSKARAEIRERIREGIETGEIQQFVKEAREQVKAKIISKDTMSTEESVKLTTQKIMNAKKRVRTDDDDGTDPSARRAKATAERDANRPAQIEAVEEEEMFFETVPKVVPAAEAVKTKEGVNNNNSDKKKKGGTEVAQQSKKEKPQQQAKKEQQPKKEQQSKKEQQPKQNEKKGQQPKKDKKKEDAAVPAPAEEESQPATEGEPKKLGKWARKAIRAQSSVAVKEAVKEAVTAVAAATGSGSGTNAPVDGPVVTGEIPVEKSVEEKSVEKKKQPAGKKAAQKKEVKKTEEKKTEAKKVEEAEIAKPEVKLDAPKITTLKVDHNDKGEGDSDSDSEEPVAPVRKVVKIDTSLLKELPEVPKRRGGRNQNKYR
ncbi:hypothetical protein BC939DRAFT_490015 [Gamsiella multidivaricata]|uniref:uncharacterized protein n=1 Tax=Gamsiella multidivaricata TaxID=101098 RepID=UPI00221ED317|nr:uncharacterized protein BC939DRAFT_490015 [Gamsiella multidivaricata]KAI7830308.1 hypothetical protein BC939DRAFT_490015 [Gamsiella multidivaricata]